MCERVPHATHNIQYNLQHGCAALSPHAVRPGIFVPLKSVRCSQIATKCCTQQQQQHKGPTTNSTHPWLAVPLAHAKQRARLQTALSHSPSLLLSGEHKERGICCASDAACAYAVCSLSLSFSLSPLLTLWHALTPCRLFSVLFSLSLLLLLFACSCSPSKFHM